MLAREVAQAARLKLHIMESGSLVVPPPTASTAHGDDCNGVAAAAVHQQRQQHSSAGGGHSTGGGSAPAASAGSEAAGAADPDPAEVIAVQQQSGGVGLGRAAAACSAGGAAAQAHPWLPGWGICQSSVWAMAEQAIVLASGGSTGSGGGGGADDDDDDDGDGGGAEGAGAAPKHGSGAINASHLPASGLSATTAGPAALATATAGSCAGGAPAGLASPVPSQPPTPPTPTSFWAAALPPGLIVASTASPAVSACSTPVARHQQHPHRRDRHEHLQAQVCASQSPPPPPQQQQQQQQQQQSSAATGSPLQTTSCSSGGPGMALPVAGAATDASAAHVSPDAVATVRLSSVGGALCDQEGGCGQGDSKEGAVAVAEGVGPSPPAPVLDGLLPCVEASNAFVAATAKPLLTPFERQHSVAQRLLLARNHTAGSGAGSDDSAASSPRAVPAALLRAAHQQHHLHLHHQQRLLPTCCSAEEAEVAVAAALADYGVAVAVTPDSPEAGSHQQQHGQLPLPEALPAGRVGPPRRALTTARRAPLTVPPMPSGLGPRMLSLVPSLPHRLPQLVLPPLVFRSTGATDGGGGGAAGPEEVAAGSAPAAHLRRAAFYGRGAAAGASSAKAALSAAKTVATLLSVMPGDASNIGSLLSAALSFVSSDGSGGDASGAAAAAAASALAEAGAAASADMAATVAAADQAVAAAAAAAVGEGALYTACVEAAALAHDGEAACEACTLGTMAAAATAMGAKLHEPAAAPICAAGSGTVGGSAGSQLSTLASWSGSLVTQVVCALADMMAGPEAAPSARLMLRSRVRAVVAGASVAWTAVNVAGLAAALLHSDFGHNPATATKTALDLLLSAPSVAEAAKDLIRIGVVVGMAVGGNLQQQPGDN
ncbi:hypothetical protein HYH02_007351 [Chlamydomonas schloesseri]|uniref:Uncharacterized protein n=1 Tax=Chlamydomonas schloesseri TaxID=2026947 RepID=A0A835WI01_9CHLO|nr:hypothetical protein HYH02_007351 [Chlamydomonas schloesseri]|eukprot:KAG2447897.1 hypothetical protein HYH02_007351 [Chlamydomonas schloesseri]